MKNIALYLFCTFLVTTSAIGKCLQNNTSLIEITFEIISVTKKYLIKNFTFEHAFNE